MTQASNVGILTPKINSSGQLDATTGLTGAVPVANGGTGAATYTANNVLLGNGTSAFQVVAPGANGNVLTSNGTTWVSQASSGGGNFAGAQTFTVSGTFTVPTGVTSLLVTCQGGGGGGGSVVSGDFVGGGGGGAGGFGQARITGLTAGSTITVTIGNGGGATAAGGTSSFGSYISCTGGSGGASNQRTGLGGGAGGTCTITGATTIWNYTGAAGGGGSGSGGCYSGGDGGAGGSPTGFAVPAITYGQGGGGTHVQFASTPGISAIGKGGGGSGAANGGGGAATGGSGGTGVVIVNW